MQHTENRADQALRANSRIDPSTLGMSVSIPLASYPGRAGVNVPVTLNFNSKLWSIDYYYTVPGQLFTYTWTKAKYAESSTAGWTTSLDAPYIEYTGRNQYYNSSGDSVCDFCDPEPYGVFYIKRIHVHLPDGSAHELRADDVAHPFDVPGGDFTGIFKAVDGSRMYFDTSNNTLYLIDGSRYVFSSNQQVNMRGKLVQPATNYIDRNGNVLSYDVANWRLTDTLGRTLDNPIPGDAPTVGERILYLPGMNTATLTYKLRWANLANVLRIPATLAYTGDQKCSSTITVHSPALFLSANFTRLCADLSGGNPQAFNPVVLSEVELPNGKKYQFKYNIYGEIEQVLLPTGGYERFEYGQVGAISDPATPYHQSNRGVINHWISEDGSTEGTPWHYQGGGALVGTTAPDGSYQQSRFWAGSTQSYQYPFGMEPFTTGLGYEDKTYAFYNGPMLRRSLTDWFAAGRPSKEISIILDTGGNALATTTTYQHDADLNVISTSRYDFVSVDQNTAQTAAASSPAFSGGALLRKEEATYLVNDTSIPAGVRQTYRDFNLVGLVTSTRIRNSVDTIVAQSQIVYDEATYMLASYGSVLGWADPLTSPRGLPTTAKSWIDTTNTWLETHTHYDRCGSPRKATDAKGYVSEMQYSSSYHYAYPTSTISADPDGGGPLTAHPTSTVYDLSSGAVTSATDANNKTSTFEYSATDTLGYSNPMQRLTRVVRPDGGWTAYGYSDQAGNLFVRTRMTLDASRNIESTQYVDGLGRAWRAVQSEGSTSIYVDTQYDSMGRAWKVSSPYRGGETIQWTTTGFDKLGRVTSVTPPDTAVVTTAYSGNKVQVTDQGTDSRSSRRSETDALGRLNEVVEFTRTLSNPTVVENPLAADYITSYKYDVLGNLRKVAQGAQARFFMYDSLSRLIRAKNPEQGALTVDTDFPTLTDSTYSPANSVWSMAYKYDNNGNLLKRKDARNITATYSYDNLNRNTFVNYSDTAIDPDITRTYDTATNGKGRLRESYAGGNETLGTNVEHTKVHGYDALGRPLDQRQRFKTNSVWSAEYQNQRGYNLAGSVASQTYPSGRTVTYNYDQAGRLGDKDAQNPAFKGNLGDEVLRTYSSAIVYSPFGGMAKEQFGTDTALYNKLFYNSRGQLAEIRVSTSYTGPTDTTWNRGAIINHYSNAPGAWGATGGGPDNNGNLKKQEVYIPHNDQVSSYTTWWQRYDYDNLNRLQHVFENTGNPQTEWQQEYIYDRWGNRTIHQTNTWGIGINKKDFTVNTANNRLGVPGGQIGTITYDNAGNQTNDTYSGAGSRTYDAENRITQAWGGMDQWQFYTYNADGQRIRRKVNGVETWQIYGMDGELLAEYAANAAAATPEKEYGYRNGQLLVRAESSTSPVDTVWVEDSLPAGAIPAGDGEGWSWISSNPVPASGSVAHQSNIVGGIHQHFFFNATSALSVGAGEKLFAYVYLDPANVPSEVMLQWNDGNWEHRAYWGANNIGWGVNGTNSRRYMGALPAAGGWVRLEVAASLVGLEGHILNGMAFSLYNGRATWDRAGKTSSSSATANITWLVSDHLGTPRMVFDKTGSLAATKRHDYLPFGEELYAGQGVRTTALGYTGDTVRQKFTSKERDNETGLDYFLARYYSSTQGRFTSPDPLYFQAMMAIDPQRFNLYAYTRNNPLKFVDPSGEKVSLGGNQDWLRTNILYEMAGGQENFDRYFQVTDGQVVARSGVDASGANAGVQELLGLVNATENYLYFAGTNGTAAADLFQGSRDNRGRTTSLGRGRASDFEGNNAQRRGGTLVGTTGRDHALQPANLANGDPVFAVIAYNTNTVQTQVGISNAFNFVGFGGREGGASFSTTAGAAQHAGLNQVIRPVSLFIHESAENRDFAQRGAANSRYPFAHKHAMLREATIRRELNITGGFAGGVVQSRVPRR